MSMHQLFVIHVLYKIILLSFIYRAQHKNTSTISTQDHKKSGCLFVSVPVSSSQL